MFQDHNKINNLFLTILLIGLIVGSHIEFGSIGGMELTAFRATLILNLVYLSFSRQIRLFHNRLSKLVFFFFVGWITYGILSLLWTPVFVYGIKDIFYLIIGFSSYLVFYSYFRSDEKFIEKFVEIWTNLLIFVLGFLLFELITQKHLPGEYFERIRELGMYHKMNFIPIFTFSNPNVLAIYLTISVYILLYKCVKGWSNFTRYLLLLLCIDFIVLTESRFAQLTLLLSFIVLFFYAIVNYKRVFQIIESNVRFVVLMTTIFILNVFIITKENYFLAGPFCEYTPDNQKKTSLIFQIEKKINKDGVILLKSEAELNEKEVSSHKDDVVFAIDRLSYYKLLKDETLDIQFKKVENLEKNKLFFGSNELFIFSLFGGLMLVVLIRLSTIIQRKELIPIFGYIPLFFVLLNNSYEHAYKDYKEKILVSPKTVESNLKFEDIDFLSVSNATGRWLISGKTMKCRLKCKKDLNLLDTAVSKSDLGSNTIRKNLILNGLEYLKSSSFMGVGAGGFQGNNSLGLNKYPDGSIMTAHNSFIEIVSQYGIIVLLLFLCILFCIKLKVFRRIKSKLWDFNDVIIVCLILNFYIMSNANSSFLSLPLNWIILFLPLIFSYKRENLAEKFD